MTYLSIVLLSGVMATADDDWTQTAGPAGGLVTHLARTDGALIAATWDGLYRSTDGGGMWTEVTAGLPQRPSTGALDAEGATAYIVVNDTQLLKSTNDGASWSPVTHPHEGDEVRYVVVDSGDVFIVTSTGGSETDMVVSEDGGQSWSALNPPVPMDVFHVDGQLIVGQMASFDMVRSLDRGETWEVVTDGLPWFFLATVVATGGDGTVYVGMMDEGVFASYDDGLTWHDVWPDTHNPRILSMLDDGVGGFYAAGSGTPGIYRTTDGGQTWTGPGTGLPGIGLDGAAKDMEIAGSGVLIGSILGLWRTDDNGQTWVRSDSGLAAVSVRAMTTAPGVAYAAPFNSEEVHRLNPDGVTWTYTSLDTGEFNNIYSLLALDGLTVLAGTDTLGIYRTTDGGDTWQRHVAGLPQYNGPAGWQYAEIEVLAANGTSVFAGTGAGSEFFGGSFHIVGDGIARSHNGGQTWQLVNVGLPIISHNNFNEPRYDPIYGLYAAEDLVLAGTMLSGIYRTIDDGDSWLFSGTGLPANSSGHSPQIEAFVKHHGSFFAAGGGFAFGGGSAGFGVFRSGDNGLTWTRSDTGLPSRRVWALASAGDRLLAGLGHYDASSFDGVYESLDDGQSWHRLGTTLDGIAIRELGVVDGALLAATRGRSVWRLKPCPPDWDGDTVVNSQDFIAFLNDFTAGNADYNGDTITNSQDFIAFLNDFVAGC